MTATVENEEHQKENKVQPATAEGGESQDALPRRGAVVEEDDGALPSSSRQAALFAVEIRPSGRDQDDVPCGRLQQLGRSVEWRREVAAEGERHWHSEDVVGTCLVGGEEAVAAGAKRDDRRDVRGDNGCRSLRVHQDGSQRGVQQDACR